MSVPTPQPYWTSAADIAGRWQKKILLGNELFVRMRDDVYRILKGTTCYWLHRRKTTTLVQRHLCEKKLPSTKISNYTTIIHHNLAGILHLDADGKLSLIGGNGCYGSCYWLALSMTKWLLFVDRQDVSVISFSRRVFTARRHARAVYAVVD